MGLDSASIWGKDIADAIAAVGVSAGSEVTSGQLEEVWEAVKGEDTIQLGKSDVAPGTFSNGGGPVGGIGGPVS